MVSKIGPEFYELQHVPHQALRSANSEFGRDWNGTIHDLCDSRAARSTSRNELARNNDTDRLLVVNLWFCLPLLGPVE